MHAAVHRGFCGDRRQFRNAIERGENCSIEPVPSMRQYDAYGGFDAAWKLQPANSVPKSLSLRSHFSGTIEHMNRLS